MLKNCLLTVGMLTCLALVLCLSPVVSGSQMTEARLDQVAPQPLAHPKEVTIALDLRVPQLAWAVVRLDAAIVSLNMKPVHPQSRFPGDQCNIISRHAMEAADISEPIWAELKFNWSHGLSTLEPVHIHGDGGPQGADKYYDPFPKDYRIAWMIRNEDIFVLRWAQADFIRQHIARNGQAMLGQVRSEAQ